jgi:hypothetical protein
MLCVLTNFASVGFVWILTFPTKCLISPHLKNLKFTILSYSFLDYDLAGAFPANAVSCSSSPILSLVFIVAGSNLAIVSSKYLDTF